MVKKFVSVLVAIVLFISMFSLSTFAEEVLDTCPKCGKKTYEMWNDLETSVPEINFPISFRRRHCTSCDYTYYQWNCLGITGYKEFQSSTGNIFIDYLRGWIDKTFGKNATANKIVSTGGASGGRNPPSGYTSDGVPSINIDGKLLYAIPFNHTGSEGSNVKDITFSRSGSNIVVRAMQYWKNSFTPLYYTATAPVDGYYIASPTSVSVSFSWDSGQDTQSKVVVFNQKAEQRVFLKAGQTIECILGNSSVSVTGLITEVAPYYIYLECVPSLSSITNQPTITINNNTWSGNIYQDTENNLTYIYPQYTTINDAGDTITNISENPIIYNNTTNQYYTYDSTTNNYYYITYVTATPEPTVSPEPTATPDPGTGGTTPTPTPGGGTSGGGSTSTPESGSGGSSGGQSWWSKLLDKLGNAIVDALLDAISTVLNLILKLFSTILGWIIWFASKSLDLLPFLPPGLSALLVGGVVVCFVIYIIKFIRG